MRMQHQNSQMEGDTIQIPADSEIFKNQELVSAVAAPSVSLSHGDVDFGNVDLTQMDPEVIRVIRMRFRSSVLELMSFQKFNWPLQS